METSGFRFLNYGTYLGAALFLSPYLVGCTGLSWSSATPNVVAGVTPAPTPTPVPTPIPVPSGTATSGPQVWHNQGMVDSGTGDYGNLFYSSAGDLYVVYSDIVASAENLNVQVRPFAGVFGAATPIGPDGRTSCMFFNSPSTMWLASESASQVNIFQSTDTGVTWNPIQSYPAVTLGSSEGDFPCQFQAVGANTNLYFGEVNGVQVASYGGAWPAASSSFNYPVTSLGSILFQGPSNYIIGSNGVYQSTNSGVSYTQQQNPGVPGQNLLNVNFLFQRLSDNSIFAANDYVFGPGPTNQNWQVWQSPDSGTTWNNLVIDNDVLNFGQSYVAAIGNLIATLVVVNNNQIYSMISYDNGVTWNLPTLLVDVSGAGDFIREVNMTASSTIIGFVYSVEDGSANRLGVFLEELY
jgi:hypothetical protein